MKISDKLHIVIPLYESGDVSPIVAYVHSAPISAEVFTAHFMLLGRTFSAIYASGLGPVAGPRVAHLLLQKVAKDQGDEIGGLALMSEIRRLTNVMLRTPNGWEAFPYEVVIGQGLVDKEDLTEVTNAIVFFTVLSATHKRSERRGMMSAAARLWDAQITSQDFTVFAGSLPTSTAITTTTPPPAGSSPVY